MPLRFTKIDVDGAAKNAAKGFDKDIKKLEGLVKSEKNKKKKKTYEKDLKELKSNRSKAIGDALADLQTLNSKEAEVFFSDVQGKFIQCGGLMGKAKKAFETLKKNPTDARQLTPIQAAVTTITPMTDENEQNSKAFVAAQGDLRNNGYQKLLEDKKHAAKFQKLRNDLIARNKDSVTKQAKIREFAKQAEQLQSAAETLLSKGQQKTQKAVAKVKQDVPKLKKSLEEYEQILNQLAGKCKTIDRNKDATDPAMMKTLKTLKSEMVSQERLAKTQRKTVESGLKSLETLAEPLLDSEPNMAKIVEIVNNEANKHTERHKKLLEEVKQAMTNMAAVEKRMGKKSKKKAKA